MKTKPYAHQLEALDFLLKNKRAALFLDTGLGKTWCALAYYEKLNKPVTIVICPNSVKYVWAEEIKKHLGKINFHVINRKITRKSKFYIVNYEFLRKEQNVKQLLQCRPELVIFDESTEIKNPFAKQTVGAYMLARNCPSVVLLNGAPITENEMDIFGQYLVLNERLFGRSFYLFRKIYFRNIMANKPNVTFPVWKFKPEMKDAFYSIVYRVAYHKRKEECLDLPPKIYEKRYIELTKDQRELYENIKNELLVSLHDETILTATILAKLAKFAQVVDGFIYSDEGKTIPVIPIDKNPKIKEVIKFIECNPNKRILIWTRFRGDRTLFKKAIKHYGLNATVVTEKQDLEDYTRMSPVTIAPLKLARYGFTLPADFVIYFSNDFSYNTRLQSEARSHGRLGLKNRVTYIDIIAKDSIDEAVYHILQQKKALAKYINTWRLEKILKGGV